MNQAQTLSPEQRQAVMMQANQEIMGEMVKMMAESCFKKCAGTSGDRLDKREQSCMALCQDRYLDTRAQVQEALQRRQNMS
mmetsp:Transcript_43477/g.49324  ORF Transcript_43477/g.49324 Transcript_43477/m.49324 type:complete len:81 (-) Transcript_43477:274-516(-)